MSDVSDAVQGMRLISAVVLFMGLLWVWPNIIHEPLHAVAAELQGTSAKINYDWGFPAHPSTTRGEVESITGGLFFLLLPTIASLIMLAGLALIRPGSYLVRSFAIYIGFDTIVNVFKYGRPTSDFHFLIAVPGGILISLAITVLVAVMLAFVFLDKDDLQKRCSDEKEKNKSVRCA